MGGLNQTSVIVHDQSMDTHCDCRIERLASALPIFLAHSSTMGGTMAASPAFATVTEFLTAHPEVIPAFKADPRSDDGRPWLFPV